MAQTFGTVMGLLRALDDLMKRERKRLETKVACPDPLVFYLPLLSVVICEFYEAGIHVSLAFQSLRSKEVVICSTFPSGAKAPYNSLN